MAIPFLSALAARIRAATTAATSTARARATGISRAVKEGYVAVRSGVSRGLSSGVIGRTLRKAGIPLPQPTVESVVTAERRRRAAATNLQFLGRHRRPNPARLPLSLTPIAREYAFLIRVTGTLLDGRETVQRWITISTDQLLSREELEQMAQGYVEADPANYGVLVSEYRLIEGMRRA